MTIAQKEEELFQEDFIYYAIAGVFPDNRTLEKY